MTREEYKKAILYNKKCLNYISDDLLNKIISEYDQLEFDYTCEYCGTHNRNFHSRTC